MGLYSKIRESKYSEGGNYLQVGVFRLQINEVKSMRTRKGADAFLSVFKVLESTNTAHAVGSEVTWMVTLDKEPAMGNIKQFLASVFDVDMDDVDEAAAELAVGPQQPAKSRVVRASATNITTKAGRPFTKVKFFPDKDAHGAAEDNAKAA
jgi:hypothetical protein